ncbi:MAG: methylenetetrahydrofolate reductase [Pseudomonadota bacterium]
MARILSFRPRADTASAPLDTGLSGFLKDFSIEVMPRTAAKIADFRAILPTGTRVYVAHIDGTPFEEMLATVTRLRDEGFEVMPHIPARVACTRAQLGDWVSAYADAGVTQALVLAGGVSEVRGDLSNAMEILETGLLDRHGFTRIHVAGHPEGNRDIDRDGSDRAVMEALRWKHAFAQRTDAQMALATQFCFEAEPVIAWAERLRAEGLDLPIHIGIAGPAKLQTLIKFAMACGVGPSLRVLTRRAADVTKLLLPFTPIDILRDLAAHKAAHPEFLVEAVHVFPLGGIGPAASFLDAQGRSAAGAAIA